jgi:YHS domain-containing protein
MSVAADSATCAVDKFHDEESIMNISSPHPLRFDAPNWQGSDFLPRDQEQSHRLHEPGAMISTIDPITGEDIEDLSGKPYIVDGNMVMYFASEETRQAYLDTPKDHPVHLQDNPWEDGEAEG